MFANRIIILVLGRSPLGGPQAAAGPVLSVHPSVAPAPAVSPLGQGDRTGTPEVPFRGPRSRWRERTWAPSTDAERASTSLTFPMVGSGEGSPWWFSISVMPPTEKRIRLVGRAPTLSTWPVPAATRLMDALVVSASQVVAEGARQLMAPATAVCLPPGPLRSVQSRLQYRILRPHPGKHLPAGRHESPLHLLHRCGQGLLCQRSPVHSGRDSPTHRRGPHRGADQLLPLRGSAPGRGRPAGDLHRGGPRSLAAPPPAGSDRLEGATGGHVRGPRSSNLVFLLDVSGSMNSPDKLPLLKTAFGMLVDQLRPRDRVAIVVYAGAAGLVLPSTPGSEKETILDALHSLEAGGSTAGGAGIQLAYKVAAENHIEGGNNRVILATDGDFNVGVSSDSEMIRLIEEKRNAGDLPHRPRFRHRESEGLEDGADRRSRERQLLLYRQRPRGKEGPW